MGIREQRRKRRSSISIGRWLGWASLCLVVLALAGVGFFFVWLRGYLHSDEFRLLLEDRAASRMGGELRVDPLRWERLGVSSGGVEGRGRAFSRLEARDVRGRVSLEGWRRGAWVLEGVRAESLVLDFRDGGDSVPDQLETGAEAQSPGRPGFWMALLPARVEVPEVDVRQANLRFGGGTDFRILETHARARVRSDGSHDLDLRGGFFRVDPFPGGRGGERMFRLRDARATISPQGLFLSEAVATDESGARLAVSGTHPAGAGTTDLRLETRLEDLPVGEVLGGDWASRVFGRLTVEALTTESRSAGGGLRHEGTATLADARFVSPPAPRPAEGAWMEQLEQGWQRFAGVVVPVLGAYTDRTHQFRNLVFDRASCRFVIDGELWKISDIQLQSSGFLAVEGGLVVEGRNLDGTLQVGVSRSALLGIPGAETAVFTTRRDGLVWAPVRVSGTLDNPQEDLTERLVAAASARIFEALPGLDVLAAAWEGGLVPAAGAALDTAGGLLEQGERAVRDLVPLPVDPGALLPPNPLFPPAPPPTGNGRGGRPAPPREQSGNDNRDDGVDEEADPADLEDPGADG